MFNYLEEQTMPLLKISDCDPNYHDSVENDIKGMSVYTQGSDEKIDLT